MRADGARGRVESRRRAAGAGVVAALLLLGGTTATHAAFTSSAHVGLGAVGGAYDIALVDATGQVVPGDPDPLMIDTVVPGPDGATAIEVDVVTTTAATGPITLTVSNARQGTLPADPGMTDPGADPYDVGLFSVSLDGEVLVDSVPAAELGPVVLEGWQTDVSRRVQVAVRLPDALGNPYYAGRAMVVGLHLDGSTS